MVAPTVIPNVPVLGESSHRHILFQHFVVPIEDLPRTIATSFTTLYSRSHRQASSRPVHHS